MKIRLPIALRGVLILSALCLVLAATAEETVTVVAVVSARNASTELSKIEVMDLFLGRASRFPDGTPALPVDQREDSPEREAFYLAYSGKSPAQLKAYWSKVIFTGRGRPPREVLNGAEVKKFILRNPGAIGYIDARLVDGDVRVISH